MPIKKKSHITGFAKGSKGSKAKCDHGQKGPIGTFKKPAHKSFGGSTGVNKAQWQRRRTQSLSPSLHEGDIVYLKDGPATEYVVKQILDNNMVLINGSEMQFPMSAFKLSSSNKDATIKEPVKEPVKTMKPITTNMDIEKIIAMRSVEINNPPCITVVVRTENLSADIDGIKDNFDEQIWPDKKLILSVPNEISDKIFDSWVETYDTYTITKERDLSNIIDVMEWVSIMSPHDIYCPYYLFDRYKYCKENNIDIVYQTRAYCKFDDLLTSLYIRDIDGTDTLFYKNRFVDPSIGHIPPIDYIKIFPPNLSVLVEIDKRNPEIVKETMDEIIDLFNTIGK